MASARAAEYLRQQADAEAKRSNFDNTWQRIADLAWPAANNFNRKQSPGERKDQYQFDSTAQLALGRFAAAMESMIAPRTQQYQGLEPVAPELAKDLEVQQYLASVTDTIFKMRYRAKAGFTTASGEHFMSLGAFGTGGTFLSDIPGVGLRYQCYHMSQLFLCANMFGEIDTVYRKFPWTARNALQAFGPDVLGGEFRKVAEKNPEREYTFIQCVKPRSDYDPSPRSGKNRPITGDYVCVDLQEIVEEGGYFSMPFAVSRLTTAPGEIYGRGCADTALGTMNTLNEMGKTNLRVGQKQADPPLMTVDDDSLRGFNMKSGAINRGYLNAQGQPLAVAFQSGGNLPVALEMTEAERNIVNEAFYVNLFQVLIDSPQMTATEALLRAQEKGQLLAPPMGRQQTEFLGPITERELDILSRGHDRMGRPWLPPPPPQLVEAGGMAEVVYTAPLNRLQKADGALGIARTLEQLQPIGQLDPSVFKKFNWPRVATIIGEANGVPPACYNTDEEMAAIEDGESQQAEAALLLEAAPVAARSALDLAKAGAVAQASPSQIPA